MLIYNFDLDGTILNNEKNISDLDIIEIEKILNRDCLIFNTGRSLFQSEKIYRKFSNNGYFYVSSCFGSYIYDVKNKKVIYENYLEVDLLRIIVDFFIADGVVSLTGVKETLTNHIDENYLKSRIDELRLRVADIRDAINYTPILKVTIISNPELIDKFVLMFQELSNGYGLNRRYQNMLEIHGKENKGKGLKFILNIHQPHYKKVISFGNDMTDISLREFTDILVSTKNCTDEFIHYADYITTENTNNPISNFIKKYNE